MTVRRIPCTTLVAYAAILLCGLTACGGVNTEDDVAAMPAIAQAEIAFVGGHTQAEIKARLDEALKLYGLPLTDENYSRAGSSLVALRKANGTPEMSILDHMIRSHVPGVNVTFPSAAGLSSAFLQAGDR